MDKPAGNGGNHGDQLKYSGCKSILILCAIPRPFRDSMLGMENYLYIFTFVLFKVSEQMLPIILAIFACLTAHLGPSGKPSRSLI